jgi:hypothetical protein
MIPSDDPKVPQVRAAERRPITAVVGGSGLRQYAGFLQEDIVRGLDGIQGKRVFEEMARNDATCAGILFAIRTMMRSMKWEVTSADASNDTANEFRDLVEEMLFYDMTHTWPEFVDNVCSMFPYGFAVFEMAWKRRLGRNDTKNWISSQFDDGLYAPASFLIRHQRSIQRWIYDAEDHLLGFEQAPTNGLTREVPMSRCLHFRTTSEQDNPEGTSLLRGAYRSWYMLKRMQEIEGIGTERDLAGYPVISVPSTVLNGQPGSDEAAAAAGYLEMLNKIRHDQQSGLLMPSDRDDNGNLLYEFKLMSTGGARALPINQTIDRYQRDIARSVAADFIFLGADGGGSLALGKTKVAFFVEALKSYSQAIASQVNERTVADIWRYNGFEFDLMPEVKPSKLEEPDLAAIGAYINSLANVGFDLGTDVELENALRSLGELPAAPDRTEDDDFEVLPSGRQVSVQSLLAQEAAQVAVENERTGEAGSEEEELGKMLRDRFGTAAPDPLKSFLEGFARG